MTLTIPAETIAQAMHTRFHQLSQKAKIDGFRPGKIPIKVIRDRFTASVHAEVLNEWIPKIYEAAIESEKIHPASAPDITPVDENIGVDQPFVFIATFDILPAISLQDFSSLVIERPIAALEAADIEQAITRIREQRATTDAEGQKQLPDLNDAFMAAIGVQGDIEALKQEVRTNLERELKYALKNKIKANVIDQLLQAHAFPLPQALIQREIARMREESARYFKRLPGANHTPPTIPTEILQETAQKNVKIGLLFTELLQQYPMEATQEKIEECIRDMATMYDDVEQAVQWISRNAQRVDNIRAQVREDMLIERILESASIQDKVITYAELMQHNPQ